ncbi:hypothetical protein BGX27_009229 [Mortierella sp. AM989]|nr:hypothetical protein BGX27_009229 [Mortierella sp. AM989]
MTYDPHVSSPFTSPPCSPHPLNPNTKWFINLASVTNIKLLPTTRSYRCFPYNDNSKELSIQTNDGRNIILRASKDIELDRWYFVLSKIWEYQQQKSEAPESPHTARNLAAHQQSAQLFQEYLQKQYSDPHQEQQEQHQQQNRVQRSSSNLMRSHQKIPRESLLPYQIPPPPRVSAFLPQGLEFSLQEQEAKDGIPARFLSSYYESQSITGEKDRRPLVRQTSWCQQRQAQPSLPTSVATRQRDDLDRSASARMMYQRSDCLATNSLEPGKAAIIDSWRRSLILPNVMEGESSVTSGNSGRIDYKGTQDLAAIRDLDRLNGDNLSDLVGPCAESHDRESTFRHSSLGLDYGVLGCFEGSLKTSRLDRSPGLGIWVAQTGDDICDNTPVGHRKSLYVGDERNFLGNKRSSHLPGLTTQSLQKDGDYQPIDGHLSQDEVVQDLKIQSVNQPNLIAKEEDELPLGLIQVKRQSRWLNTQLSSEDGLSVVQRASQSNIVDASHRLLPSEPITPERTPGKLSNNAHSQAALTVSSRDMQLESHSLDIHRFTPSLSTPSLSLHGSSYSHLPIHDPDFVFTKPTPNAYSSANERPTIGGISSIEPCKITQSATAPPISAADRGLFTARHPRRGFSIPTPSSGSNGLTSTKKYIAVETIPYTNITIMNSNPPKPMRPQDVSPSPMLPESDHAFPSQAQFVSQLADTPPPPQVATYKQQYHRKQPSLSRSISAMSSVSQAYLHRQSRQSLFPSPYQPDNKLLNGRVGDEEDEDEPLGLTLSRQQSNKQQRRLSQRIYPDQRPLSMASHTSPAALMRTNSGMMLHPNFEQAPLRTSGASFSYF